MAARRHATSTGTRRTPPPWRRSSTPSPAPTPARCRRRSTRWACALLDDQPGIAEIKFSAPNKHHFLVDFSGFDVDGLTNDGEVFIAADRPYGLIEAQVGRDDAPPAGDAWLHIPGFC